MKRIFAFLTVFLLLAGLVPLASAEETGYTLSVIPPVKTVYELNEEPDYTGGFAVYTEQTEYRFPLTAEYCSGFETATPGNHAVTVQLRGLESSFLFTVLSAGDPIKNMKDIDRKEWCYTAFRLCMRAGYFAGDNGRLRPYDSISRAEMAQIIYRAWQNDPLAMAASPQAAAPFSDVSPEAWYYQAVEACRKAGILRGDDGGRCNPNAPILRQDAILMLMRLQYTDQEMAALNPEDRMLETGFYPTDLQKVSPYALPAVLAAMGTLVKGDDQGAINPTKSISRAEAATILYRIFLEGYQGQAPEKPLVYLSPSNQFANRYAGGITTEGAQMTVLATRVKELLEAEGYPVVLASGDRKIDDRAADANAMGADLYIPIHSNAGGNTTGTYVFYRGDREGCKEFSKEIFDRLAALTGTAYSESRHKEDYLSLQGTSSTPFREIQNPNMLIAYLEVEFHDKLEKAQWIVDHNEELALAIAQGVMAYSEQFPMGG